MYNIIIFGTGRSAKIVESGLNKFVNIVCYLDNDNEKWGKRYNGKKVLNPKEIFSLSFDYVVIASQYNDIIYKQLLSFGVNKEVILQFYKYYSIYQNHIKAKLISLNSDKDKIEVLATGISYMANAIDEKKLCKKGGNIAYPSQDLYYDYNIVKYMLKDYKKVKYVLIGLSYYSFQYDMSLSSMKGNVILYYDIIHKEHNFCELTKLLEERKQLVNIGDNIFKLSKANVPIIEWNVINSQRVTLLDDDNGKRQALNDGNKNYPETVKENKKIFIDFLKLLKKNNIKPIVIVCPTSKYYSKYFPQKLKDEFYNIIKNIRQRHEFQFLDYFDSEMFYEEEFYDVSHLNSKGAEKFTKMLNEKIEW